MKKTDIAMIILIASISAVVAFFSAQALLGGEVNQPVKYQTAEKISSNIDEPDERIFNDNAINPTVEVFIGEGATSEE